MSNEEYNQRIDADDFYGALEPQDDETFLRVPMEPFEMQGHMIAKVVLVDGIDGGSGGTTYTHTEDCNGCVQGLRMPE